MMLKHTLEAQSLFCVQVPLSGVPIGGWPMPQRPVVVLQVIGAVHPVVPQPAVHMPLVVLQIVDGGAHIASVVQPEVVPVQ
jgi:hypothetical protein